MANEGMSCIGAGEFVAPEAMQTIAADPANMPAAPNIFTPVRGVRMPHGVRTSLYFVRPIPHEMTLAAGLTFTLVYALPSVNNAYLGGGKVVMDAIAAPLVSGVSHLDDTVFGNPQGIEEPSPDLPTVPGTIVVQELVAPLDKLVGPGGTLAPGGLALIRVRRTGDDPGDTNVGDILFISVGLRNT